MRSTASSISVNAFLNRLVLWEIDSYTILVEAGALVKAQYRPRFNTATTITMTVNLLMKAGGGPAAIREEGLGLDNRSGRSGNNDNGTSQQRLYTQYDDHGSDIQSTDNHQLQAPHDSNYQRGWRQRDNTQRESSSHPRMPARSKSQTTLSRSSRSGHECWSRVSKPMAICVDGVPSDKNGCCFRHPNVKLASKKLLGAWKVHLVPDAFFHCRKPNKLNRMMTKAYPKYMIYVIVTIDVCYININYVQT